MHLHTALTQHFTIQRLPGPEALADIMVEWELLDKQITPRVPFTAPAWIVPWWGHFRRQGPVFRDEFFCHVVRDGNGRLVAIAPLMRTFFPCRGPAMLRILQFFGTDASLTEFRGVICHPLDHEAVVVSLAQYFRDCRTEWDVIRWSGLRQEVSFYNSDPLPPDFIARRSLSDYYIDLPSTWEALRNRVSSNMRKNLRKAYEFLKRDNINFVIQITQRPSDVSAAMERFLTLHAARSEASDMIHHPNKFDKPRTRAFLADYLLQAATREELRIFELDIGGAIVASRLSFVLGSTLYLYFAGYDPRWKDYSVMTVLVSEMIQWAVSQGLTCVNLSTGTDQSKMRWKPTELILREAVQVSPTVRGRLAFRLFRGYEAIMRGRAKYSGSNGEQAAVEVQPRRANPSGSGAASTPSTRDP